MKMHFCQIFGLSKLHTGRENGSQKGITRREFGSQNHLPDENLALKTTYRMRIWPSNIFTGHDFFLSIIFAQTTIPDLKFWIILTQLAFLVPGLIIMSQPQPLVCLCLHTLYRQKRRGTPHLNLALMVCGLGKGVCIYYVINSGLTPTPVRIFDGQILVR